MCAGDTGGDDMHAGRMKWLSVLTALFLCSAGHSLAHTGGREGPLTRYLSPLPDSRYILPGTNIIIRIDRPIEADAASKLIRSVTGRAAAYTDIPSGSPTMAAR